MANEFEVLWLKAVTAQAKASALSSYKAGTRQYEERLRRLAEVDEVVIEILSDHIEMVALSINTREGGNWQVLQLTYNNQTLNIPWPKLGETLQTKVKKEMTKTQYVVSWNADNWDEIDSLAAEHGRENLMFVKWAKDPDEQVEQLLALDGDFAAGEYPKIVLVRSQDLSDQAWKEFHARVSRSSGGVSWSLLDHRPYVMFLRGMAWVSMLADNVEGDLVPWFTSNFGKTQTINGLNTSFFAVRVMYSRWRKHFAIDSWFVARRDGELVLLGPGGDEALRTCEGDSILAEITKVIFGLVEFRIREDVNQDEVRDFIVKSISRPI